MRFSSRAHYGLQAMMALARSYPRGPTSLTEIAKSEDISLGYLEQLMALLRRAGLVEGTRGAHGGYQLTTAPVSITVGQVLRALEGPVAPTKCASEAISSGHCRKETNCLSKPFWEHMRDSIAEMIDTTTLADLCSTGEVKAFSVSAKEGS